MWMPVLSPMVEIPRLRYPGQMLYLFAQSIVPTVPATFLTFADGPIYPFYGLAAPLIGVDPVIDQRVGRSDHEDHRRPHPVGVHRRVVLPVAPPGGDGWRDAPGWQELEREANRLGVG